MESNFGRVEFQTDLRKPYEKPAIIHELELETRAGSPYPTPFAIDPIEIEKYP